MEEISFAEIHEAALRSGFHDCGVCDPEIPKEDADAYDTWLKEGLNAHLAYMENRVRLDPQSLFPDLKSVIMFVTHYKQEKLPFEEGKGLIASYARGRDYHHIHKKQLKEFIGWLEKRTGKESIARGFSDSFPLLEKALAAKAGLGFFGKNTLLIHPKFGTFVLISGILTSIDLPRSAAKARLPRCGSCTKCLDACPTSALISPYRLDAAKCLSSLLIESKGALESPEKVHNPGYIFGCDICQDVCPHNVRKPLSLHMEFSEEKGQGAYITRERLEVLLKMPEELYGSPLNRRGALGLKANAETLPWNLETVL